MYIKVIAERTDWCVSCEKWVDAVDEDGYCYPCYVWFVDTDSPYDQD